MIQEEKTKLIYLFNNVKPGNAVVDYSAHHHYYDVLFIAPEQYKIFKINGDEKEYFYYLHKYILPCFGEFVIETTSHWCRADETCSSCGDNKMKVSQYVYHTEKFTHNVFKFRQCLSCDELSACGNTTRMPTPPVADSNGGDIIYKKYGDDYVRPQPFVIHDDNIEDSFYCYFAKDLIIRNIPQFRDVEIVFS